MLHGYAAPEIQREIAEFDGRVDVEIVPPSSWDDAVERIAAADVALVTQGRGAGDATAVAAKVYEYLALGRPVLAMTDGGATEALLRRLGADGLAARLDDPESIERALDRLAAGDVPAPVPPERLRPYDRRVIAAETAALLDSLVEKWSSIASTIRSAACPSQSGGTAPGGSCAASSSAGTSAIRSGASPSRTFVPSSTVTGRSVLSRSVKHGIPRNVVSSWIPPESVRTPAEPRDEREELEVAERFEQARGAASRGPPRKRCARARMDREDDRELLGDVARAARARRPAAGRRRAPGGAA